MIFDLILEHEHLLNMLKREDEDVHIGELVQVVACPLNPGIPDLDRNLEEYMLMMSWLLW
jgi:hypothetical protein